MESLALWQKIVESLLIFVYIYFVQKTAEMVLKILSWIDNGRLSIADMLGVMKIWYLGVGL